MRIHLATLAAASLVATAAFAQAPSQSKVYTFPQIRSGSCVMAAGSTLTLSPDGTGVWKARTSNDGSGPAKVWHVQLFGESANNTTLFFSGNFQSPPMTSGKTYEWTGKMKFDPGLLPAINHMRAWSHC